jgi:hypothetical protein
MDPKTVQDTTYNPDWLLTDETERYLRAIFNELQGDGQDGTIAKTTLMNQVRAHSLLTEKQEVRLGQLLADFPAQIDWATWKIVVLKWREICPESIEAMWKAWIDYRLGPTLHLDAEMAIQHDLRSNKSSSSPPSADTTNSSRKSQSSSGDLLKRMMAGGLAGMAAKTLTAPIDRIKILFQVTDRKFSFRSASELFMHVCRTEGPVALWRGNNAQLLRVFPYAGIQFMCYDFYKGKIRNLSSTTISPGSSFSAVENLFAGAFAGATSVAVTYPLDCLRARLAVEEGKVSRFTGLGDAIRSMYVREGVAGFYRGVTPTLLGILPYAGLAFAANDTLRARASVGGESGEVSVLTKLVCGGLSGLVAQSLTYPLDVIRRRQQTEGYVTNIRSSSSSSGSDAARRAIAQAADGTIGTVAAGAEGAAAQTAAAGAGTAGVKPAPRVAADMRSLTMRETAALILRTDGPRGLFKGLAVNWVKAPVAIGVSFTLFDWFKEQFGLTTERPSSQ